MGTMFGTAHPYEWMLLGLSVGASSVSAWLFTLKIGDLITVRSARRQDAPLLYHVKDEIRHQGFVLAWSAGLLMLAITGINNPSPPQVQALNMIVGGMCLAASVVLDGALTFLKRRRMRAVLAAAVLAAMPGGKRATDPQP